MHASHIYTPTERELLMVIFRNNGKTRSNEIKCERIAKYMDGKVSFLSLYRSLVWIVALCGYNVHHSYVLHFGLFHIILKFTYTSKRMLTLEWRQTTERLSSFFEHFLTKKKIGIKTMLVFIFKNKSFLFFKGRNVILIYPSFPLLVSCTWFCPWSNNRK